MTWVKLDESFAKHPKVLAAGPLGMAMQVAALCYCNTYLTDGFVPRSAASGLLDLSGLGMNMWSGELVGGGEDAEWELVAADLIEAGLWEEVKGGFVIHDYHDYQPTKAEVLELREKRSEAGRKGGQASRQASAKQVLEQVLSNEGSKRSSKIEAKSKPVPGSVPVSEPDPNRLNPFVQGQPLSLVADDHEIRNGTGIDDEIQESMRLLLRSLPDANDKTVGRLMNLAKKGAQQSDFHDARAAVAACGPSHPSSYACKVIEGHLRDRA
jgi:general stress protein YciG